MVQKLGFFAMLHSIYAAIGTMASAVQRGANSLDNLGQWAEEQTATFVDEARDDRALKAAQRKAEYRKELEALKAQGITVEGETKVIAQ